MFEIEWNFVRNKTIQAFFSVKWTVVYSCVCVSFLFGIKCIRCVVNQLVKVQKRDRCNKSRAKTNYSIFSHNFFIISGLNRKVKRQKKTGSNARNGHNRCLVYVMITFYSFRTSAAHRRFRLLLLFCS